VPGLRGPVAHPSRRDSWHDEVSEMEKVPKIVGERLKAAAVTVDHPDPDLLTAFSERSLPDRERSQVLEHLARCGECRDVIALALPAEESTAPVIRPVRGRWLTWPRLRWGLVAAGVLVVGSFGVLRHRETSHPAMVASYDESRAQEIAKAKNQTEPLPATPAAATNNEEKKTPVAGLLDRPAKSKPAPEAKKESDRLEQFAKLQPPARDQRPDASGTRGMLRPQALPHGPKAAPTQQWQQNVTANANNNAYAFQSQAPAPAVPPEFARQQSSNQVVVSAQAKAPVTSGSAMGGPISSDKRSQDLDILAGEGRSVAPLSTTAGKAGGEVARAKPAETSVANASKADAEGAYAVSTVNGSNFSQTAPLATESARWSINAMGGLQRSLDQGKSWQDVDVTRAMGAGSGVSLKMAMKSSREKALSKDKSDMKQAPVVFRAVSANGPDVWAGGSSGHLYHSTDSGGHWVQVVPTWSGVVLTDDIVSLQFADPLQGRIVTSSSEIWTTSDAGQTWQKR
jgi:hypothetical protein